MKFMMPVKGFRNMKAPTEFEIERDIKRCYCYVAVSNIPEHLKDYSMMNLPVADEPSVEKIAGWLTDTPDMFHHYAPAISIHASHFVFDNRKNKLFIDLEDTDNEGIVLGRNTLEAIIENRLPYSAKTPDGEIYVELEIIKGLSTEEIVEMVRLRQLG